MILRTLRHTNPALGQITCGGGKRESWGNLAHETETCANDVISTNKANKSRWKNWNSQGSIVNVNGELKVREVY